MRQSDTRRTGGRERKVIQRRKKDVAGSGVGSKDGLNIGSRRYFDSHRRRFDTVEGNLTATFEYLG